MSGPVDVTLTINGRRYPLRLEPRRTLLDAIRDECGLTGTNSGCEHGVCGSCTVLVDGDPVRACLMFAVQAQGRQIRTVERVADLSDEDLLDALSSNLCRCTGYQNIIKAVRAAAAQMRAR